MQAIVESESSGFRFSEGWGRNAASLLCIGVSAALAVVIFEVDYPGSAVALCFVLPLLMVLKDWLQQRRPLPAQVLPLMTCVALAGVALEPGFLNITLTWCQLCATAIAARTLHGVLALQALAAIGRAFAGTPFLLLRDFLLSLMFAWGHRAYVPKVRLGSLVLPLVAVTVFGLLLATANPLIAAVVLALHFEEPLLLLQNVIEALFSWQSFVFGVTAFLLWPILRGSTLLQAAPAIENSTAPFWHRTFFKPSAVAVTVLLLNLLFATENALDIWHVWMKAALPDGMSHAEYVHRGSYTLIVTAILAGLLMVFALWKGTATERSALVRLLVYVWTAQNLLLVASSAKRTFDYIDAYGWTEWRLAGLLWMGLVFFGIASIFWRVGGERDTRWLVNVNLLATTGLLLFCATADLKGFIARQSLEAALKNPHRVVDFTYLEGLGASSIGPLRDFAKRQMLLIETAARPENPWLQLRQANFAERSAGLLQWKQDRKNTDWRSWTLRFSNALTEQTP